jgi:hypothetical protein
MRWDCSKREAIGPACSEVASGVVTGAMIGVTGARTAAMTGMTGGMTAATAVADPGCCGDSSMRARTSKTDEPSPLSRTTRVDGSVTW